MKTTFPILTIASLLGFALPGLAGTYEVTSLGGGTETGTLRWAVDQANADQLDDGQPHEIVFQENLEGTVDLGAEIEVTRDMILQGPGADRITLMSANNRRAFFINAVERFSVTGLRFTQSEDIIHSSSGGGIRGTGGEILIRYCLFENCEAATGGAIACQVNDLLISESTFIACAAESDGGAIWYSAGGDPEGVAVANATFYRCEALNGAVLWARGPLVEFNHATVLDSGSRPTEFVKAVLPEGNSGTPVVTVANCALNLVVAAQEALDVDAGITIDSQANVIGVKTGVRPPLWYGRHAGPGVLPVPYCLPELDSPVVDAGADLGGASILHATYDTRGASRVGRPDAGAVELRSITANDALALAGAINLANAASSDPIDYIALEEDFAVGAALPTITGKVIIMGHDGSEDVTRIDGSMQARPFTVATGAVAGFENLMLFRCQSTGGGAILNEGIARVRRCWFTTNQANCGGAIRSVAGSELEVRDCTFSNNVASADSGAVEIFGGTAKLENCSFAKNHGNRGGALGFFGTTSEVLHCSFSENTATLEGGAMRIAADATVYSLGNAFAANSPDEVTNYGTENPFYNVTAAPGDPAFDFDSRNLLPFPALHPELDSPFVNASFGASDRDQTGRLRFDFFNDAGAVEYLAVDPYLGILSAYSNSEFAPTDPLPFLSGGIDPLADLDGDGEPNFHELYFRGDPYDARKRSRAEFFLYDSGGSRHPAYRFQIDERLNDAVRFKVSRSTTLETWVPLSTAHTTDTTAEYHPTVETWDQNNPVSSADRAFYHLGIHEDSLPALFMFLKPVEAIGNVADGGGLGAVDYRYGMSAYETTNVQWMRFLNAVDAFGDNALGLYDSRMASETWGGIGFEAGYPAGSHYFAREDRSRHPVNYVDYLSVLRFCNWLHHGAPAFVGIERRDAILHDGAYTIAGGATPTDPDAIVRNPGARYFLPTHDEWIKGGHYNRAPLTIGGFSYFDYPVTSNNVNNLPPSGDAESANFAGPGFVLPVLREAGSYSSARSAWDLYDMGGNVAEMIEHSSNNVSGTTWSKGGSFVSNSDDPLIRNRVTDVSFTARSAFVGFRIAGRP